MSEGSPFADAFASTSGALSMRDVLARRCAEQAVEIAALRKECARLRKGLEEMMWVFGGGSPVPAEALRARSCASDALGRP